MGGESVYAADFDTLDAWRAEWAAAPGRTGAPSPTGIPSVPERTRVTRSG